LRLAAKDTSHIELFKKQLKSSHKIRTSTNKEGYTYSSICLASFCSFVSESLLGPVSLLPETDWLSPALASPLPITTAVKADQNCASVAAASVAAKVERDALMATLAEDFVEFGWASNKGYGSADHMRLLPEQGTTVHHRVTWVKK